MTVTTDNIQGVIEEVRRQIEAKEEEKHLGLRLGQGGYRLEDEWLYVSVDAMKKGIHADDYAQSLGEIEQELRAKGFEHILLLPFLDE